MAGKSVTKRQQRKGSRRMRGGMTTGEHAIAVYGDSNSQVAVGNGSNVIKMNDPSVVAAPMRGGRKMKGGDLLEDAKNWLNSSENQPTAPAEPVEEEAEPVAEEAAVAMAETAPVAEEEVAEPVPVVGGKKKSAKKHRKSHKKSKASKKRMHKRR